MPFITHVTLQKSSAIGPNFYSLQSLTSYPVNFSLTCWQFVCFNFRCQCAHQQSCQIYAADATKASFKKKKHHSFHISVNTCATRMIQTLKKKSNT